MPWLINKTIAPEADRILTHFIGSVAEQLDDSSLDRNNVVREQLAQVMYGSSYDELAERSPIASLALDPRNITFEAERYIVTDEVKFASVKPILWFWKTLDQTPLGQSIESGLRIRRMLAERVFAEVGKNVRIFQNVEVSVGYNIVCGDEVTIHRHVLIDDIGGVVLHDHASVSDYANIYSHTHDVHEMPDVTLKKTVIGKGVRVAYHATVLAGTVLSDDSMVGAMGLANRSLAPHAIGLGVPAKPRLFKCRPLEALMDGYEIDARHFDGDEHYRANPDFQGVEPPSVLGKPCR